MQTLNQLISDIESITGDRWDVGGAVTVRRRGEDLVVSDDQARVVTTEEGLRAAWQAFQDADEDDECEAFWTVL